MSNPDYGYELYASSSQKFKLFYPTRPVEAFQHEMDYGQVLHQHIPLAWWERVLSVFL